MRDHNDYPQQWDGGSFPDATYGPDAETIDYAGISAPDNEGDSYEERRAQVSETDEPVIDPLDDSPDLRPASANRIWEDDPHDGVLIKVTEKPAETADDGESTYEVSELAIRRPLRFQWDSSTEVRAVNAAAYSARQTTEKKRRLFQNAVSAGANALEDTASLYVKASQILERIKAIEYPESEARVSPMRKALAGLTIGNEVYSAAQDFLNAQSRARHLHELAGRLPNNEHNAPEVSFVGKDARDLYAAIQFGYKILAGNQGMPGDAASYEAYEQNLDILSRRIRRTE